MKKKQNYNPLQFSLFDDIKTHKDSGNEKSLEGNWKSVVEYLKSDLPWKGRVLYDMIKEQQPERFLQMKQSKELIPFLQKITEKYYAQMDKHIIGNGMMEIEADEMEWPQLTKAAGLI
jgi:hypothetical protein